MSKVSPQLRRFVKSLKREHWERGRPARNERDVSDMLQLVVEAGNSQYSTLGNIVA